MLGLNDPREYGEALRGGGDFVRDLIGEGVAVNTGAKAGSGVPVRTRGSLVLAQILNP
jgi:hypothetical protein